MYGTMNTNADGSFRTLAYEEWLGEPQSGDINQGAGVSTSQLQNPNVSLPTGANKLATLSGPVTSPWIWVIVIGILILTRVIHEKGGGTSATVSIGLDSLWRVGLLAMVWFYGAKVALPLVIKDPGNPLRQFVGAV
jgi:hypothetical protein